MNFLKQTTGLTILLCFFFACANPEQETKTISEQPDTQPEIAYESPLGRTFSLADPSPELLAKYDSARADYEAHPDDVDKIIWYGRRTAYLGRYPEAIDIYTAGIQKFPDDPRLYRHRGHRYISLRKFDEAIADLSKAGELIQGTENEIEPDGMPNAQGIPISSLHGNIWYHLGLAHYLKGDMKEAYDAYLKCREAMTNDDNIVSSTHWLYMIQRRLGNEDKAKELLGPIRAEMNIIENFSYYELCKFYKGLITLEDLDGGEAGPANDAVRYGLANWHFYNDDREKAKALFEQILESDSWNSFGYIAAEQDYLRYFR